MPYDLVPYKPCRASRSCIEQCKMTELNYNLIFDLRLNYITSIIIQNNFDRWEYTAVWKASGLKLKKLTADMSAIHKRSSRELVRLRPFMWTNSTFPTITQTSLGTSTTQSFEGMKSVCLMKNLSFNKLRHFQ